MRRKRGIRLAIGIILTGLALSLALSHVVPTESPMHEHTRVVTADHDATHLR